MPGPFPFVPTAAGAVAVMPGGGSIRLLAPVSGLAEKTLRTSPKAAGVVAVIDISSGTAAPYATSHCIQYRSG